MSSITGHSTATIYNGKPVKKNLPIPNAPFYTIFSTALLLVLVILKLTPSPSTTVLRSVKFLLCTTDTLFPMCSLR